MSIYNRITDASIIDIFVNVFQRRAVKVFLANALKVRTIHKYVLYCEWNITGNACWLVFAGE